jgi:putative phosphoribosyl transferase
MVDRAAPASSHNLGESANRISRFSNLRSAGTALAEKLRDLDLSDVVVLAIARGGVPAGHEVATQLGLLWDLILIKRLFAPNGPDDVLCAVSIAGTTVIDEKIDIPVNPSTPREFYLAQALNEFEQAEKVCRGDRSPIDVTEKKIILVDCGMHTGSTMKAAVRALRRLNPARITAAVPVVSPESCALIEPLVDELVCLARPDPFVHTGMWYEDLQRPADEQIPGLLGGIKKAEA